MDFFKRIIAKEYVVWADCGKHFRNNQFVGYLLLEVANDNIAGKFFSVYSMRIDFFTIRAFYRTKLLTNFSNINRHGSARQKSSVHEKLDPHTHTLSFCFNF